MTRKPPPVTTLLRADLASASSPATRTAVVTPPDFMSQLILFAAVYPLYEISIFLIRRIEKKREADLRAEGLWDEDDETGEDTPKA